MPTGFVLFAAEPSIIGGAIKVDFGSIKEKFVYTGVSYLGKLNFEGHMLNIWAVDNTYEDEDGSNVPYFPADGAMVTFPKCGHLRGL